MVYKNRLSFYSFRYNKSSCFYNNTKINWWYKRLGYKV